MLVNELHQGGIRAILDYDNTVFDNFVLPEDISSEDLIALIIDTILYKYGDTPLFSPDPAVLKFYIGRWSARRGPLWLRYWDAVFAEYDPLHNYDRYEKKTLTHGKKVTYSGSVTDGTSGTITDTPSGTYKVERDDTTTDSISADNSTTFVNDRQSVLDGETNTSFQNYKEERTFNQYEEKRTYNNSDTNSGKDEEDNHIYGNIGVVTSQTMLISELDLIPRLDFVEYVADDFHNEFCLMMYY